MRTHLLCLLFAVVVIQAQVTPPRTGVDQNAASPQPKAKLEGAVFNAATGELLRRVTLRLRMTQSAALGSSVDSSTYVSESDAAGRYLFEDLEPGRYTLSADRSGFVRQNYGARSNSVGGTQLSLQWPAFGKR